MIKTLSQKEQLQKQLNAIAAKEEKEMIAKHYPEFKKLIGKCYKTRNSYGGSAPKPWFFYTRITEIKPSDVYNGANEVLCHYKGYSFQTDCYGSINIEHKGRNYVHCLGKEITENEFNAAFKKMVSKIAALKKL